MAFPQLGRSLMRERSWSVLVDLLVFAAILAGIYAVLATVKYWMGVVTPAAHISRSPAALPAYAFYSLVRMAVAYVLSLVFAVAYGYIAANNRRVEMVMIAVLDILQSIPVLSFLPSVMLAMVALFPTRQLGVELGSIVLIFTGQVWNMAFSFYSSLKSIPRELREAALINRFSATQRFVELELPFGTIGLVWNSIVSVAGGWFFLMACEMFVLGNHDFRLPGLGSYLQTASSAGDTAGILWGLTAMIAVIVLIDQLVWRPAIAWSDKFKMEQVESAAEVTSPILHLLRNSDVSRWVEKRAVEPLWERLTTSPPRVVSAPAARKKNRGRVVGVVLLLALAVAVPYLLVKAALLLKGLPSAELLATLEAAAASFGRVAASLGIASLWAIPAGVAIGFNPRLSKVAQPLAQIAASVFRFTRWQRWRTLILPGIFPYLVTGLVTASGGAWNASIVAEYFHFQGKTMSTLGLGAQISAATDSGNSQLLLVSTIVMAMLVVCVNRLVWRPLYRLAGSRYRLDS